MTPEQGVILYIQLQIISGAFIFGVLVGYALLNNRNKK